MKAKTIAIAIVVLSVSLVIPMGHILAVSPTPLSLPGVTWTDDFNSSTLNSRWSWIRQNPSHWSLTANPGFFQITTEQSYSTINNLLVQNAPPGNYTIETKLTFTPTQNFQIAGLLIYLDDNNSLQLGHAYCVPSATCVGNGVYFDYVQDGGFVGGNFATVMTQSTVYLRIARQGSLYSGYLSLDGTNWTKVGDHTISFSPTLIGLKASNQAQGDAEISANFDYFTLVDNSSRLFLPYVTR